MKQECIACHGTGVVTAKCFLCKGQSFYECRSCDGLGYNYRSDSFSDDNLESIREFAENPEDIGVFAGLYSDEYKECDECGGEGVIECQQCDESGEFTEECSECDGFGVTDEEYEEWLMLDEVIIEDFTGKGIVIFPDGEKYKGEFKDGEKNGFGIQKYPEGNKYIGEWENGL